MTGDVRNIISKPITADATWVGGTKIEDYINDYYKTYPNVTSTNYINPSQIETLVEVFNRLITTFNSLDFRLGTNYKNSIDIAAIIEEIRAKIIEKELESIKNRLSK